MNQADLAIIHKKGATDKPENYRPIALLSLSYKILAKMIQVRLCNGLDDHRNSQQYGFRKARSTSQPFFIYRIILEMHEEAGLEMYTLLLDWEKAFDKVDPERMIIVLKRMGIPEEMTDLISSIYKEPQFNVKDGKLQSSIKFQQTGIRQGCLLSPYLFIILLSAIMKDIVINFAEGEANVTNQGKLCKATFNKLFYADDTLIMTTTTEAAELILHKTQKESALYNLKLNQSKCCLLRMNAIQTIQYEDGQTVPIVNRATYLGATTTANGNYHAEISARIAASLTTLQRLDIFWNKTQFFKKWKLRVYGAVITTKLLYGLESASLSNTDKKRLDAFQNEGLRKILGIKHAYFSRIRNQQVIATASQ